MDSSHIPQHLLCLNKEYKWYVYRFGSNGILPNYLIASEPEFDNLEKVDRYNSEGHRIIRQVLYVCSTRHEAVSWRRNAELM